MPDFSQLFLYIPGIVIFLVGSNQVRTWLRYRRSDVNVFGTVFSCQHVTKKDSKDRSVYDYYNVVVEYTNPKTSHKERQALKSPTEYAVGQEVRITRDSTTSTPVLSDNEDIQLFHPLVTMIGGALLIVLALEQNQQKEVPAMICLSVILAGAGINLLFNYFKLKKRNLQPITTEITGLYSRQISKESKIIKGSKFTYYPVVTFQLNGKETIRRCNINSSLSTTFKVGDPMTLYYDAERKLISEKKAHIGLLIAGAACLVIGLLAGASILSVIL